MGNKKTKQKAQYKENADTPAWTILVKPGRLNRQFKRTWKRGRK